MHNLLTKGSKSIFILLFHFFLFVFSEGLNAEEVNSDGWPLPDLADSVIITETTKDVLPNITGKETTLRVYRTSDVTVFNVLIYNGRVYAYYIDTDGKPPMEYSLVDLDGDGIFRHRYKPHETSPIPTYLKNK